MEGERENELDPKKLVKCPPTMQLRDGVKKEEMS